MKRSFTLLVAESHRPTLDRLLTVLTQTGYIVLQAEDPGTAMERFVADGADAVLVAIDFPRLDGAHLSQLIRSNARGARTPVVVLDRGHLGKVRGVGSILDLKANGYIADPLKATELLARLQTLLQSAEDSKEASASSGIASVLAGSPVAAGELRGHPLPAQLHSLYRLSRDGILVVAHRELTRRIFLLRGSPVAYDSNARQDTFARFLVDREEISEEQSEALLRAQSAGMRIGAALAEAGVALEGEELLAMLGIYTRDKVAQVIGMRSGRYAFYAGGAFAEAIASVDIPALAPILEGARHTFPIKVFGRILERHLDRFPRRSAAFSKDLPELGLGRQDIKIAMQVNGRIRLRDLLAHGRGELRESYALFWFLHLVDGVSFFDEPEDGRQGDAAGGEAIAPRRKKKLPPEEAASLREGAVKILTGSYFKVLGLDITADGEEVERAYREVASRYHPDTHAEHDVTDLEDLLSSVQDKLAASYKVLADADRRRAYLQYLFSRLDVRRGGAIQLDAEIALRRGERALKRGDLEGARQAFELAVERNPREPEYYCYLAWATFMAAHGPDSGKAAQRILKKALGLNPYLERALVIGAIVDAELGELQAARKRLLKALELNPSSQLARAALRRLGR